MSTNKNTQLASSISSLLDIITNILNNKVACIYEDLQKSRYKQNLIYNIMETHYQNLDKQFSSIEAQLVKLSIQPQTLTKQSPQQSQIQYQPVARLEQVATGVGQEPPLVLSHTRIFTQLAHLYPANNIKVNI